MAAGTIDIGDGVWLRPATGEDIAWAHAHLREGDRMEHALCDGEDVPAFARRGDGAPLPGEMAVVADGRLVGYAGMVPLAHESHLSRRRFVYYLSTEVADTMRVRYVRRSRDAMRAFLRTAPAWVDEFVTVPMLRYAGAVRWLERILGFRRVESFTWRGERFAVHSVSRRDIEEGKDG